ncbi:MAG: AMP-binding protein [Deltaproteobacteria bacterium]|nr:AMP-binding protein [Deltaproteobacteria bacterium]
MNPKELYLSKPWLKHYTEGVPAEVEIPDISVPQLFDEVVAKYGQKTFVIFYGKKLNYLELKDAVDRMATALADLGVIQGDTVALYLLNSPQYIISYLATLRLGAKVTPISPVYTSIEVKHQIEDSDAKTAICQDILYDNLDKADVSLDRVILTSIGEYLPALKKLFGGKGTQAREYEGKPAPKIDSITKYRAYAFQDLLKKYPPNPPEVSIDPAKDLAVLPYTGGTTGLPKAAMLTHRNLIALTRQVQAFWTIFEEGKEVVIAFLPFFHIYGQVVVMLSGMSQGYTLVLFTTPDIEEILSAMERYQASAFYGVPTLFQFLTEYEKTDRINWKKLKLIACGADTLHEATVDAWEKRTGATIYEGYGMTETTAVSHSTPHQRSKKGSFGIPIPGVKAAVINHEGTEYLPVGEVGEMVLSGPNIMRGYWKRPDGTAESMMELDGEVWLRTGDLVSMDEEGYFHFFDRKRDLIKYKGYSVFARHVEEVLYQHPQIKAAGVVGVPNPAVGAVIKAYVVLESEARGKISEEEIIAFCHEKLAHYKVPKIIEFRGELPKTDVGKVSRRELREENEET